jgi:hypothetical protein
MKLKLKEDPREWRKATLLSALGLAILSTLLWWRRILPPWGWAAVMLALCAIALSAWLQPRWFRGYYRLSTRLGFALSQFAGRAILAAMFLLVLTPLGWALRLFGKDLLRLKRNPRAQSYWQPAKKPGPLPRLF